MRIIDLEARALAATDVVRRGEKREDDFVEFKRDWPASDKVRQLAAAANQAGGEPLIWIIGMDETTGDVHPLGDVDPADWWASFSKRFDEVVPDLLRQTVVTISATETVVAFAFGTDAAPYVVTTDGGSPEREVPIRDGTRTRSARRHEILRMLIPSVGVPPAEILRAQLEGRWQARRFGEGMQEEPEMTTVGGFAEVFVEHIGRDPVMLPAHRMAAVMTGDGLTLPLVASLGAQEREGVRCKGPRTFVVRFRGELDGDRRADLRDCTALQLALEFGVAGAARSLRLSVELYRRPEDHQDTTPFFERFAVWKSDAKA